MSATRNPRKRKGRSKKQFVEEAWAKRAPKMPSHSYGPRKGLEGPFQYRSGKVLYWDAKEGAYYDPGADMYLSSKDAQAFIINPRKRKNPGCRDARGFVPTPQCRGQQKAILLFFHEMKRSDPKFTLKDAWEISKGKKPVTKLSKKTLAKAKRDAPVAEQTALAFNPRKRKNPGKFFVVVDTSVPGGKWVRSASGSTIHTKATLRQADRQAESLERTTGRPHQVIDAEWYGPAREVLIKTGMIGKTNPRKRKNARRGGQRGKLARQKWMLQYSQLTGDPQPKPHDYWDTATAFFLMGTSAKEAAKKFNEKQKKSNPRKETNAYAKRYTLTSFSEKYWGKRYKDVPSAIRREFWDDFKYAFVGGLERYKKETRA